MLEVRAQLLDRERRLDVTLDRHVARVVENAHALRRQAVDERASLGGRGSDRARRGFDEKSDPVVGSELGSAGEAVTRALTRAGSERGCEDSHVRRTELRRERGERRQSCRRGERRRPALDADAPGRDVDAAKGWSRRAGRLQRLPGSDPPLHRGETDRSGGAASATRAGCQPRRAELKRQSSKI